ncbi:ABC transporter ATP-binding protein [Lysobacter sp. TY2-98]|uniref:ABC transporter ATP-binding protein n=1 Tax=Lysobacter sp. TY2-98 TaxID=2290922 RepID=UPI000E206BAB|nr:ABC transporter ATP-binding protein [Lysobacter sp. TY2-98]AXK71033.1 ABC transporter ATP-binding protein [Lysobacter sp. TY2-98]
MTVAIRARGLGCRFGGVEAVRDLDLDVPTGAIYGFLGPNGAGKTTTIRMILGLLRPTAGAISLFGHDVQRERLQAARLTGAMVETPCHYDHLTGRENLAITARLLGVPRSAIDRVLGIVSLSGDAGRRVGAYSLGMRQRLGVARALLGSPRLLVLDEPTNGLDPHGVRDMRLVLRELPEREGVTVLVSSHALGEIDQIATHVGLMDRGALVLQGTVDDLRRRHGARIEIQTDQPEIARELLHRTGLDVRVDGDRVLVHGSAQASELAKLNALLVRHDIPVHGLGARAACLEEMFHELTLAPVAAHA